MALANKSFTGTDSDPTASKFFRSTGNHHLRHLDGDMFQWDKSYSQMEIAFEFTSSRDYKNTNCTRKIARAMNAHTMLVRHRRYDTEQEHPVTVTLWYADGNIDTDITELEMTWDELWDICKQIHDNYAAGIWK